LQIGVFFINFAAELFNMLKNPHHTFYFTMLLIATFLGSCQKQPQKVRHLHEKTVDSTMLAQMQINIHLADAADKVCREFVQNDSVTYAMDDFGFWYAKTISTTSDSIQQGQEIPLHIQIIEIGGTLISDIKHHYVIGSGELPTAITRSLRMMCIGEQMQIVAPWYTAYRVEGTSLIKPYSNLFIIITIEQ